MKLSTNGIMMKKISLILIATLFTALSSFAQVPPTGGVSGDGGGPKQSWGEIIKNPNLRPTFPTHDIEGRKIGYNHLCLMGERIRTKYKQIVSSSFEQGSKIVFDYLVTDRVREEEVCAEMSAEGCLEWETVTIKIPLESKIKVYKRVENSTKWEMAFEKMFDLPECNSPLL